MLGGSRVSGASAKGRALARDATYGFEEWGLTFS